MIPRATLGLALILTASVTGVAFEDPQQPVAPEPAFAVVLRYEKETKLTPEAVQLLKTKAVELLETSNFNSGGALRGPDWTIQKIHESYRQTISGNYLVVSFKETRQLKTMGGEVNVQEIVVGLNGTQYATALFTIDREGRVIGHAKYSGLLCIQLLETVKTIAKQP